VLGFRFNEILANPYSFTRAQLESADDGFWKESAGVQEPRAWLALLNPVDLDVEEWLTEWNIDYPNVPCVGGFASGTDAEGIAVFHNGVRVDGGALIAFSGAVDAETVVSQGCRPIGEPLPVTRAEANVVYSLGSRPAYQALEAAYQTLADTEKAHARGNLFAGLASNEYVEDFKSGDFLVRNIIGADPETGAVVINGVPRVGQTMQYQFRDRTLADADLRACIATSIQPGSDAIAAIVFTCLGRGVKFFETENHDAALIAAAVTPAPVAGFFCSAEIGPIAGINSIHAYTASALILRER